MLCRYALRLTRPIFSARASALRRLCTPPSELDDKTIEQLLMIGDVTNKPTREVILSETGEEILELGTQDPFDKSYDWDEFERRFGIYDVSDEEIDRDYETLKKKLNIRTERVDKKELRSKRARPFTNRVPKKMEGRNFSVQFVDDDENPPHDNSTEQTTEKAIASKPERTEASDGFFSYMATEVAEAGRQKEQTSARKGAKNSTDPIHEQIFAESDALKQPAHQKRPGFERRVMNMERQMERIVEGVLCTPGSEWCKSGGDVEQVLLSPNMKNLTIYYNVEESEQDTQWWKKMNTKYAGIVRTALATRLETKYVPRVFFDEGKQISGKKDELNSLFHQIESERAESDANTMGKK